MTLVVGKVTAKGTKENVLEMFENLEEYYDKNLLSQSGTAEDYTIIFDYSARMSSFFCCDSFLYASEEYECEISAEMTIDDGDPSGIIRLHYNRGEMICGLVDNGIDPEEFDF